MAYGEYAEAGCCTGKCLYQLSKIGVPLRIVESVIFENGSITLNNVPFAEYQWVETTPIFKFADEFDTYNELQLVYLKLTPELWKVRALLALEKHPSSKRFH